MTESRGRNGEGVRDGQLLVQGAATYVLLGLMQNGVNFLLLPFFARALSPGEYGRVGLLLTLGAVTTVIGSLCLDVAVFRGHFKLLDNPLERSAELGSLLRFLIVYPVGIGVAAAIGIIGTGGRPLGFQPTDLAIGVLSPCLLVAATVAPLALLRAEQRYKDYSLLVGSQLALQIGLKVTLVLLLDQGVTGWVLADLISGVFLIPVGVKLMGVPVRGMIVGRHVKKALALTMPMLPHRLAHWGLALSDRLVLATIVVPASLGFYTVGYQIAAVVGLAMTQLNQAVMPFYGRVIRDPLAAAPLRTVATAQALLTAYVGTGMALLGPLLVVLVLPPPYAEAATIIPLVALGQIFFGMYFIPTNALGIIDGDTNWLWVPTLLSALVNVSLNLSLVPRFGILAAAASTAATYLLLLGSVIVLRAMRGKTPIPLFWRRLSVGIGVLVGLYSVAASPFASAPPLKSLLLRICLLVIGGLILLKVSGVRQLFEREEFARSPG